MNQISFFNLVFALDNFLNETSKVISKFVIFFLLSIKNEIFFDNFSLQKVIIKFQLVQHLLACIEN